MNHLVIGLIVLACAVVTQQASEIRERRKLIAQEKQMVEIAKRHHDKKDKT